MMEASHLPDSKPSIFFGATCSSSGGVFLFDFFLNIQLSAAKKGIERSNICVV